MKLDDLVAHVGAELFRRACEAAWAAAAGTGKRLGEGEMHGDLADVPHELADLVEGNLDLAFALYRVMPCYANLMYVGYWGVGSRFWAELRSLLDDPDDRLADPALYWLWCGPFEGSENEAEGAWREMLEGAGDLRLRRLLEASGPVPWRVKAPLLERLAREKSWHRVIWQALKWAAYDTFGAVDPSAARRLLDRLAIPVEEINEEDLRAQLDQREEALAIAAGCDSKAKPKKQWKKPPQQSRRRDR